MVESGRKTTPLDLVFPDDHGNKPKLKNNCPIIKCKYCNETFLKSRGWTDRLKNHEACCDSKTKFKKNFTKLPLNERSEKILQKVETDGTYKDHKCEFCGKTFSMKTNLKYHVQKIHDKIQKKKKCEIDRCHYTYKDFRSQDSNYKRHLMIQHFDQKFQDEFNKIWTSGKIVCPDCNYVPTTTKDTRSLKGTLRNNLKFHYFFKHGILDKYMKEEKTKQASNENSTKKLICNLCQKIFQRNDSLRRHQKHVHEKVRYSCDFCDKKFSCQYKLRKHTEKEHLIEKITKNIPAMNPETFKKVTISNSSITSLDKSYEASSTRKENLQIPMNKSDFMSSLTKEPTEKASADAVNKKSQNMKSSILMKSCEIKCGIVRMEQKNGVIICMKLISSKSLMKNINPLHLLHWKELLF